MDRILVWFGRHRVFTFLLCLAYVVAVSLGHGQVNEFVLAAMKRVDKAAWLSGVGLVAQALIVCATVMVWRGARRAADLKLKAFYWITTVALTVAVVRLMSFTNNEYIHFLQYALLAIPVFALTQSFGQTAVWTTLGGAVDEGWQYAGLNPTWGIPYDFNDVIMNACGAGLGVVVIASLASTERNAIDWSTHWREQFSGWGWRIALAILAIGLLLFATGLMTTAKPVAGESPWFSLSRLDPTPFWFYDATWGPKSVHLLLPVEGAALMALFFVFFGYLDKRLRWSHWS